MNYIWHGEEPINPKPERYECLTCHRKCYATKNGYLPTHRKKGERRKCNGSNSSVKFHKKV